ncbi:N,N-dimethylformamidase beta subunit family domain-containing protein, partial [Mesorhizobium sp. M0408]|uniref:N,N-dimethylformamidase beta subunit family domain-containing protein n=1 Tax=Mesorhizobium sp. M0408 TaxID=2956942 RepID=UPI00333CF36D
MARYADQCSVEGCGWETTFEFKIGDKWPSGGYRVTLTAEGRGGLPVICHHVLIVLPKGGRKPGRILQVAATGTWLAYNTWGGSNITMGSQVQIATSIRPL